VVLSIVYLWKDDSATTKVRIISARKATQAEDPPVQGDSMSNRSLEDANMPAEIDFSKGTRGLHHIPLGAKVFLPACIERSVWEYFSGKAEQKGIELSER
jgi:hypothetical protein